MIQILNGREPGPSSGGLDEAAGTEAFSGRDEFHERLTDQMQAGLPEGASSMPSGSVPSVGPTDSPPSLLPSLPSEPPVDVAAAGPADVDGAEAAGLTTSTDPDTLLIPETISDVPAGTLGRDSVLRMRGERADPSAPSSDIDLTTAVSALIEGDTKNDKSSTERSKTQRVTQEMATPVLDPLRSTPTAASLTLPPPINAGAPFAASTTQEAAGVRSTSSEGIEGLMKAEERREGVGQVRDGITGPTPSLAGSASTVDAEWPQVENESTNAAVKSPISASMDRPVHDGKNPPSTAETIVASVPNRHTIKTVDDGYVGMQGVVPAPDAPAVNDPARVEAPPGAVAREVVSEKGIVRDAGRAARRSEKGASMIEAPTPESDRLSMGPSRALLPEARSMESTSPAAMAGAHDGKPAVSASDVPALTREVHRQLGEGRHEVRLFLKPVHLGELRVVVESRGDAMELKFTVQNEAARETLSAQARDLTTSLRSLGWNVTGFSVDVGGQGGRLPDERSGQTGHPRWERTERMRPKSGGRGDGASRRLGRLDLVA